MDKPQMPGRALGEVWEHDGAWLFPDHPENGLASTCHKYPTLTALTASWSINIIGQYVRGDGTLALLWERRVHDIVKAQARLAVLAQAARNHLEQPNVHTTGWLNTCVERMERHVRDVEAMEALGERNTGKG